MLEFLHKQIKDTEHEQANNWHSWCCTASCCRSKFKEYQDNSARLTKQLDLLKAQLTLCESFVSINPMGYLLGTKWIEEGKTGRSETKAEYSKRIGVELHYFI